jgi:hypothetical protein
MFPTNSFLAASRLVVPVLAALCLQAPTARAAMPTGEIEMTADRWEANGSLSFASDAGHPDGVMTVRQGGAILKGVTFASGTIEYDLEETADNQAIAGIWFRQQGTESAENFYLRTDSDCPCSIECLQYAPVSHGQVQWEVYPQYEAGAPVHATGWNHVKLVISGQRMNVFVNGQAQPALQVGELAGDAAEGAIQLRGDARFANVRVVPGAIDGLVREATPDPTAGDGRFVRHWQVSPVSTLARGAAPAQDSMPLDTAAWESLDAERGGFVNIARRHATARGTPDLAWLRTTIVSDRPQTKHVRLGWGHEVWIYVGGQLVFADRNVYYPAAQRKPPLGRVALENGSFELPLAAGANEVTIAISDDLGGAQHWGWGFEMRLDDIDGVRLMAVAPAGM